MSTIGQKLAEIISRFKKAGIDSANLDAEILIAYVLKFDRYRILIEPEIRLTSFQEEKLELLVKRREKREPVAYLINKKEFYGLDFYVDNRVLIPRPETEFLVDYAIKNAPLNGSLLDLCTGSGAIAVSIKYSRKDLFIQASDFSSEALSVASKNNRLLLNEKSSIEFIKSDLFENISSKFDIIVTNPPYINPDIKSELTRELEYEPALALFARKNGSAIIQKIILEGEKFLNPDGQLLIEISPDLQKIIKDLISVNGYKYKFFKDYSGHVRFALLIF